MLPKAGFSGQQPFNLATLVVVVVALMMTAANRTHTTHVRF